MLYIGGDARKSTLPDLRRREILPIREYIDTHTDKKITLDELSGMFFISKTQIFRLFTREYGIPPMRYMLKKKIEVSKGWLTDTDMRISEIAEAFCFTDAKHYTKTFRAFTGMLPREYRQAKKKINTDKKQ